MWQAGVLFVEAVLNIVHLVFVAFQVVKLDLRLQAYLLRAKRCTATTDLRRSGRSGR